MAEAVRGLKVDRAGIPLVMRTEDSKGWLQEATRKKDLSRRRWEILVRLVQRTFGGGTPPKELAWETMVLIPKGKGEFWGIELVEVAWKVCAAVVNCRLKRGVVLHDALHGFGEGRGTGRATLESKLTQQLAGLAHGPLFKVFLDICKEYDSLDRG